MSSFSYTGSGTITISSGSSVNLTVTVTNEFIWDFDLCIPRWFRVESSCSTPPGSSFAPCKTQVISTVAACKPTDICGILKRQGFVGKISSIKEYPRTTSVSANKALGLNSIDPSALTDVTPPPNACGEECCDYLVEYDLLVTAGCSFTFPVSYSYTGRGTVTINGSVVTIAPTHTYQGSGTIILSGAATTSSSVPILFVSAGGNVEVMDENTIFASVPVGATDATAIQNTQTVCCPISFNTILLLRHNLNQVDNLAKFLTRNNLQIVGIDRRITSTTLDDFVKLTYSARRGGWQGNLHFIGFSPFDDSTLRWDILFEFGCVDTVNVTQLSPPAWKFSLSLRSVDSITGEVESARLVTVFTSDDVCTAEGAFGGFSFACNVLAGSVVPTPQSVVFHDNDSLFSASPLFASDPSLRISIYPSVTSGFGRMIDYSLTQAYQASVTLGS